LLDAELVVSLLLMFCIYDVLLDSLIYQTQQGIL